MFEFIELKQVRLQILRNYFIQEFRLYKAELQDSSETKNRKNWQLHKAMSKEFNW
jgi:hypothetical protein